MHPDRPEARSDSLRIAICVVTHQRPEGLLRLLGALDGLERLPGATLRAIVIDNDAAGSARAVCDAAAARVSYPLVYAVEKRRGIPQARNRALAEALGDDFVAFVDDDEVPEPRWLAELLAAQRRSGADAVAGPCLPRFAATPPAWVVEGRFFERPRYADGAALDVAYTHNVLVRAAALAAMDSLFDEDMALCGGEDVEFFRRFARRGLGIAWADAAVVHEVVPASRTRLRWLLRRALRVGASNARVRLVHAPGPGSALALVAHGSWCIARGLLGLLAAGLRGRRGAAARGLHLVSFGVGRWLGLAGLRVDEYRSTDGR